MKNLNVLGFGLGSLAMMGVTVGLVGCGDSGTTEIVNNNYTSGMEIVDKVSDLPKCTSENAGDQALVNADGEAYYCSGKEWKVLGGTSSIDTVYVAGGDIACTTENLADSSGVNIVCNGEVIGTVLNGKDGADGKDGAQGIQGEKGDAGTAGKDGATGAAGTDGKDGTDGVGCSVASSTETSVTIKCGNDTFNMNLNGSSVVESSSSEAAAESSSSETVEYAAELPELSGVSQKGPFVTGSEVKGYELDGTRSFAQTGRSFTGKINSDDGKFSINSVKLVSTQVLLSATGYYRNEVTGENSKSPISLYAVTDLSDRKNVNVNLLTHLEYDRVAYKMKNSDGTLKIKAAKKAAQQEILKTVFGIENANFGYSEDLNIFGTTEGDAALLALSILLQGDRSEADLTALLTAFGQDIEKDGTWGNLDTRGTIAKWAVDKDFAGEYGKYKGFVKDWNPDAEVPAFEKYLRTFWSREYGLGICGSDSVPVGTVKNATNNNGNASDDYAASYTSQGNKKRFICVDADSLKWRVATDIEMDTAGWGYGSSADYKVGEIRNGSVNTNLVYVYENGAWRDATPTEMSYATVCLTTDALKNRVETFEDVKFICKSDHNWSSQWSDFPNNKSFFNESISYGSLEYAGQTYKTVKIGTQTWMAENLNYDPGDVSGMGSYAWHGCYGDTANCSRYGRLYTWEVAMNDASCAYGKSCSPSGTVRGICPEGWHIPTEAEFRSLLDVTGEKIRANKWLAEDDVFGFSLLPAGYRNDGGNFDYVGRYADLWSSTENGSNLAFNLGVDGAGAYVSNYRDKYIAFSVRCLQD